MKIKLVYVLLCICLSATAQKVTVQYGDVVTYNSTPDFATGKYLYKRRWIRKEGAFYVRTDRMSQTKDTVHAAKLGTVINVQHHRYFLYYKDMYTRKPTSSYLQEIDSADNDLGSPKSTIVEKEDFNGDEFSADGFYMSPDSLIIAYIYTTVNSKGIKLKIRTYTEKVEKLWERDILLSGNRKSGIYISDIALSNSGKVAIAIGRGDEIEDSTSKIQVIDSNSIRHISRNFLQGKFILGLKLDATKDDKFLLWGTYASNHNYAEGVVAAYLNDSICNYTLKPFEEGDFWENDDRAKFLEGGGYQYAWAKYFNEFNDGTMLLQFNHGFKSNSNDFHPYGKMFVVLSNNADLRKTICIPNVMDNGSPNTKQMMIDNVLYSVLDLGRSNAIGIAMLSQSKSSNDVIMDLHTENLPDNMHLYDALFLGNNQIAVCAVGKREDWQKHLNGTITIHK